MRKLFAILIYCAALFGGSLLCPQEAAAQFTKVDATKTPSKTTNWFQTQKAKCEKTMESVQNSQFGQFVGDAVKYTKDGIKYAKDMYEKGMDLYNQTKDSVLDSPEYKSAMISKEIAAESKKLKELQEQKLKKQQNVEAEMDLLKEQTAAKVAAAQKNLQIAEQAAGEDPAKAAENALVSADALKNLPEIEDASAPQAPSAELQGLGNEINQIQSDMESRLADMESEIKDIDSEYEEKILNQGEKVAKLTQQLSEVASESGALKNKKTEDSAEALKKNQNAFFSAGTPSIREENKIKRQRQEALSATGEETLAFKSKQLLAATAKEDKIETKKDLADTMPGESEGSGVSAEVLTEQLNVLRSYIELVLADLKLQASLEVNRLRKIEAVPVKTTFNLCDYTDPSNVGLEGVKKKADKAMSAVNKLQQTAAQVKENVNQAQEKAAQVQDAVKDAKDVVDAAKSQTPGVPDVNLIGM